MFKVHAETALTFAVARMTIQMGQRYAFPPFLTLSPFSNLNQAHGTSLETDWRTPAIMPAQPLVLYH
jgi:hypothetical protein